jgi:hypothetical protein
MENQVIVNNQRDTQYCSAEVDQKIKIRRSRIKSKKLKSLSALFPMF